MTLKGAVTLRPVRTPCAEIVQIPSVAIDGLKFTVNNREYEVTPLPPYLVPITSAIRLLSDADVKSVEEAKKNSEEIKILLSQIMAECVTPKPDPRDIVELYLACVDLIAIRHKEVDRLFFPSPAPPQADSTGSGPKTESTTN